MHTVRREFWQLPELTAINRLPMTSCLVPFPSPEAALGYDRFGSEWVMRLNGTWQFRLFANADSVPESAVSGATAFAGGCSAVVFFFTALGWRALVDTLARTRSS